jgi:hypothetical protein
MQHIRAPILSDQFELGSLYPLSHSYRQLHEGLSHSATKAVAQEFASNLDRFHGLGFILPFLVEWSATDQFFNQLACIEATGRVVTDFAGLSEEEQKAARAALSKLQSERNAIAAQMGDQLTIQTFGAGVQRLNEMMSPGGKQQTGFIAHGIESLLSSLVIGLWTACEVCLSDLWVGALNEGPKRLVKNVIKESHLKPDSRAAASDEKQIAISALAEYGYDLTGKMGDLLKDTKKVDFQSLRNTQKAYLAAFRGNIEQILSEKDQSYANITILSAIRNVLLHRGGKIDREFKSIVRKAVGNSISSVKDWTEGDTLIIRGGLVKGLHESVVDLFTRLLVFVDKEMGQAQGEAS